MPVQIEWYLPYRVIDVRSWGDVTLDEIHLQSQYFAKMLAEGEAQVPGVPLYLLYDATEASSMPPLYMMLKEVLPVLRFKNRGPAFLVTRSRAIRSIFELFAHVTRFELFTFATREEAIGALEKVIVRDNMRHTDR